ncbi:MAG: hypothetical protein BMS9Abin37_1834 [Acidobacteriota bacterium]|nr:MAG: hypothetical protein BMS9Abin37_1834 [Acidobacteriota bacterium]
MTALPVVLLIAASVSVAAAEERSSPWNLPFGFSGSCGAASTAAIPDLPSNYYGIDMIPTKRVPGTGAGVGIGVVTFSKSPYGVSVTPDGTYLVDVQVTLDRIKPPKRGVLTAWATKDDLTEVKRLGTLDASLRASGQVGWNKFLLVVTLEPSAEPTDIWSGPVVMRGMSRSGLMHTLAGHGPYQQEPCAKYGF